MRRKKEKKRWPKKSGPAKSPLASRWQSCDHQVLSFQAQTLTMTPDVPSQRREETLAQSLAIRRSHRAARVLPLERTSPEEEARSQEPLLHILP